MGRGLMRSRMQARAMRSLSVAAAVGPIISWQCHAADLYVDFDHSGYGTLYSSGSVPSVPAPRPVGGTGGDHGKSTLESWGRDMPLASSYRTPLGIPSGDVDARELQRLEEERLRTQREQKAEREAGIRRERVRVFLEGQDADDARLRESMSATATIERRLPEFERSKRIRLRYDRRLTNRLRYEMDHVRVPSPARRARFQAVLFLGTGNSPAEALAALREKTPNPFTGRPFDNVLAFGKAGFAADLPRAIEDHALAEAGLLSQESMTHLNELRGARIEEVVAHSNGATVAEMLIRNDLILGVKRFSILGGDAALLKLPQLQALAIEKGIQIRVYANQGDVVPLLPTGWSIRDAARKVIGPLKTYQYSEDLTYHVLGIANPPPRDPAQLSVQLFSVPTAWNSLKERHIYANYYRLINARRMMGCLSSSREPDPRCRL